MGPTRLRCLSAGRQISKIGPSLRAGFSTTRIAPADESAPRASPLADLLAAVDSPRPSSRRSTETFNNPIKLPPRQKKSSSRGILDLLDKAQKQQMRNENAAASGTRGSTSQEYIDNKLAEGLTKQITRRWRVGDIYTPHDLTASEMAKWRYKKKPTQDAFDVIDMNPMDHYRNFALMSEYMTPMGRIKHSRETGLRPVNQRRIARAIRRTIGMGMMPSIHQHPEILRRRIQRTQLISAWKDPKPM